MSDELDELVTMRTFRLVAVGNNVAATGVVVGEGVQFGDGQVAVRSFFDTRSEVSVYPEISYAAIASRATPIWISPDDPDSIAAFRILIKGLPLEVGVRFSDGWVAVWDFVAKSIAFGRDVEAFAGDQYLHRREVRWLNAKSDAS